MEIILNFFKRIISNNKTGNVVQRNIVTLCVTIVALEKQ
jgi:hypothetical protein